MGASLILNGRYISVGAALTGAHGTSASATPCWRGAANLGLPSYLYHLHDFCPWLFQPQFPRMGGSSMPSWQHAISGRNARPDSGNTRRRTWLGLLSYACYKPPLHFHAFPLCNVHQWPPRWYGVAFGKIVSSFLRGGSAGWVALLPGSTATFFKRGMAFGRYEKMGRDDDVRGFSV